MAFQVIRDFRDSDDNLYHYREGDLYPRDGYEPSEERIAELMGTNNRIGKRLIIEIGEQPDEKLNAQESDSEFPKHVGGGVYELSNGEKVRGKDAAVAAQAELDTSAD